MAQVGAQDDLLLLAFRVGADDLHDGVQRVADQEGVLAEADAARLDLGHVQNLVDESQQVISRYADLPEAVGELVRVAQLLFRNGGHAKDGVHRRADVVAHPGEKLRLGVIRPPGALIRLLQRPLGRLVLRLTFQLPPLLPADVAQGDDGGPGLCPLHRNRVDLQPQPGRRGAVRRGAVELRLRVAADTRKCPEQPLPVAQPRHAGAVALRHMGEQPFAQVPGEASGAREGHRVARPRQTHGVVLVRSQVDVKDAHVHAANRLQGRLAHVQAFAVFRKRLLHAVDVPDRAHDPAEPPLPQDGAAAHPVPAVIAGGGPGRDDTHFEHFAPPVADVVERGRHVLRVDERFVPQPPRIVADLPADDPLSVLRLVADKGVGIHKVLEQRVGAGLHGHAVHLLLLFELLLEGPARRDVDHGALDDRIPLLRAADNHVGALQPVDRAVAPARAELPVLAVPHLVQQQIGLPQHDAVLLQHRAEHAAVPVAQALLHASVSQQGERRPIEGDQVAFPAFAADKADDPAGDGVVDAGEQRGLLPEALGVLLGLGHVEVEAVDHPVAFRVPGLLPAVDDPFEAAVLAAHPVTGGIGEPAVPERLGAVGERVREVGRIDGAHGASAAGLHEFLHRVSEERGRLPADKGEGIGLVVPADLHPAGDRAHDHFQLAVLLDRLRLQRGKPLLYEVVGLAADLFGEELLLHHLLVGVGAVDVRAAQAVRRLLEDKGHPLVHLQVHLHAGRGGDPHPPRHHIDPRRRLDHVVFLVPDVAAGDGAAKPAEHLHRRAAVGEVLLLPRAQPGELRRKKGGHAPGVAVAVMHVHQAAGKGLGLLMAPDMRVRLIFQCLPTFPPRLKSGYPLP